ncbi:MAG: methyltransferase domain-containing protein [Candidatus Eisenbacteria bacterium]|nr:methyltransferase domain-containing protein [Candidatus Eisenbacteria bacterium]
MSGVMGSLARTPTGRWSVWKFNWLANHKIIRALEKARLHARGVLLDVGCGSRPFARLFEGRVERYLGTDLAASRFLAGTQPDAYARAEQLPFRDGSVDTVLGLSMLTYLPEPLRMLEEARRVLRPGGVLLLEFTQMAPLHDEPHDYFRFTRYGAAWLLERAGFEPVEFLPIGGLWARVGLSTIAALNRVNRGPTRVLTELPVRALYVLVQVAAEIMDRLFSSPREVLAHLVVARRRS